MSAPVSGRSRLRPVGRLHDANVAVSEVLPSIVDHVFSSRDDLGLPTIVNTVAFAGGAKQRQGQIVDLAMRRHADAGQTHAVRIALLVRIDILFDAVAECYRLLHESLARHV